MGDGDWANHDGVYGQISDVKLKQDITDMRSYWDDFASLQYHKFRHKTDVEADRRCAVSDRINCSRGGDYIPWARSRVARCPYKQ